MMINEVITDDRVMIQGYIVRDGFVFKSLNHPVNVWNAIVLRDRPDLLCFSPRIEASARSLQEQIDLVNQLKLQNAVVIADNIGFLTECPTLQHLKIIPSDNSGEHFDFSPIYEMPDIKTLYCANQYGRKRQFLSEIDYSRVKGLVQTALDINKGEINYNKVETLKTLSVYGYSNKNHDLYDLFCSKELDTLRMTQCGIHSLNGIETSKKMQCLYLYYNRSLRDISALEKVKDTIKALRIENCPKIEDFSVLGELGRLELLELSGRNILPNLQFIKSMKNLKTFVFSMEIMDGDLSPCLNLSYVYSEKNRKHYNLRDKDLPKSYYVRGNEDIEVWRRQE